LINCPHNANPVDGLAIAPDVDLADLIKSNHFRPHRSIKYTDAA